ncbi:MAG: CPBP family intramembrane glutamic endopeptidase [Bryobacteraceae bacterium]|nr:CPBP family intramembrane glutamic endopeptidase [Bryobacteraceae bacterium]
MSEGRALTTGALARRVGLFAFLEVAALAILGPVITWAGGYVIGATLSTFAAAALANAFAVRIWERGKLADIGLGWTGGSGKNLLWGLAGGAGAALATVLPPLAAGAAYFERDASLASGWGPVVFLTIVLLFGAVGEEMLFRGYGFQLLMGRLGAFATILPAGLIFGLAHGANLSFSPLGLVNTAGWGILLGYAFLRTGELWMPIGLHFGWNWVLPLFGVKLSGFTMGVTGYALRWRAGELWSGGEYGVEASLLTLPVLVLLFFYVQRAPVTRQHAFLLRNLPEA